MAKETYYTHKRDLLILAYLRSAGTPHKCPKRPMNLSKEAYHMAKETYYTHKRVAYLRSAGTLHKCLKRPMNLSKEATNSLKKRPIKGKRDLL